MKYVDNYQTFPTPSYKITENQFNFVVSNLEKIIGDIFVAVKDGYGKIAPSGLSFVDLFYNKNYSTPIYFIEINAIFKDGDLPDNNATMVLMRIKPLPNLRKKNINIILDKETELFYNIETSRIEGFVEYLINEMREENLHFI